MKYKSKLKIRANNLKGEITAVYYAYKNPGLNPLPKFLILLTLGYALSPVDLIPDFIPVLGYLDDLIILPALLFLSIKAIPDEIMEEARRAAVENPVSLSKNWIFAVIIIFLWVLFIALLLAKIRLPFQ